MLELENLAELEGVSKMHRVRQCSSLCGVMMEINGDSGETKVLVRNPRTHGVNGKDRYTTYLIEVQSDSNVFSLHHSTVRRRYSDFVWLRSQLAQHFPELSPPVLPGKTFFSSRFDSDVIENRKEGLCVFLEQVTKETLYLSDSTLHLFLQTDLPTDQITQCTLGKTEKSPCETILEQKENFGPGSGEEFTYSQASNLIPPSSNHDAAISHVSVHPRPSDTVAVERMLPHSENSPSDVDLDTDVSRILLGSSVSKDDSGTHSVSGQSSLSPMSDGSVRIAGDEQLKPEKYCRLGQKQGDCPGGSVDGSCESLEDNNNKYTNRGKSHESAS